MVMRVSYSPIVYKEKYGVKNNVQKGQTVNILGFVAHTYSPHGNYSAWQLYLESSHRHT